MNLQYFLGTIRHSYRRSFSENQEIYMRALNLSALILIIVGGVNWLLVGAADFDLVATLFGGQDTTPRPSFTS
ncbi:DUF378 domain-containing protein [Metarhizobium album]|uniref:DUF378 domain-containing protein n=1 Tax=Metarhizobium album TaxID=2182425 RepID=UPI003B21ED78